MWPVNVAVRACCHRRHLPPVCLSRHTHTQTRIHTQNTHTHTHIQTHTHTYTHVSHCTPSTRLVAAPATPGYEALGQWLQRHPEAGSSLPSLIQSATVFLSRHTFHSTPPVHMHTRLSLHTLHTPCVTAGTCGGTSLPRNSAPLGPYSRTMPRTLWLS